jgi:hypothetical protein
MIDTFDQDTRAEIAFTLVHDELIDRDPARRRPKRRPRRPRKKPEQE